jgi:TolB-like protein/Tfp pilus assembly protein PilF
MSPGESPNTKSSRRTFTLDNHQQQAAVHAQLERILASSWFSGSTRMSDFLRFAIHSLISGNADHLKETVIGVHVFAKDPGYSPREDPVVRVMAGRLRSKLAEYYLNDGQNDAVIIELPKGSYVPQINFVEPHPERDAAEATTVPELAYLRSRRGLLSTAIAAVLLALAAVGAWRYGAFRSTPSIAILPIESLANDPVQDYFSEGVTDAFITEIAKLPGIRVLSRTSVLRFRKTKLPVKEVAQQLGVRYVLVGTVFRQGDRIRLTTQLIAAQNEHHIWAETYDREARDLLTVESEVSAAVARQVQLRLSPREEQRLRARRTLDSVAQDTYLRARYLFMQRNPESLRRSIEYYKATIAREPNYAPAYAGLADAYAVTAGNGWLPSAEVLPHARAAANKALELDPELGEAHTTLASIADFFDWNWKVARQEFETAIRLRPNNSTAHQWYGEMLALSGKFDAGIAETKRALELDPFSPIANSSYATVLYRARKYDEALTQFRKTLELFPDHVPGYVHMGMMYIAMNRLADAITTLEKASSLTHEAPTVLSLLGCAYGRAGEREKAEAILARVLPAGQSSPMLPASVYIGLGERSKAIDWLDKGFLLRSAFMDEIRVDPFFDPLRNEPRFKNLIARFRELE